VRGKEQKPHHAVDGWVTAEKNPVTSENSHSYLLGRKNCPSKWEIRSTLFFNATVGSEIID